MLHEKEWINGPYKIKYNLFSEVPKLPDIKTPIINNNIKSKVYNINYNLPKPINETDTSTKLIPWMQASVKSNKLFIMDTKNLTII